MADQKVAMRMWNQRTEYSRLNWKLRQAYECLFAKVEKYARIMQETYARSPKAVGAIIDDLFDFATYYADPQHARLEKEVSK